jgi:hypothetical protein
LCDAYHAKDIVLFNQRMDSAIKVFQANQEFYATLIGRVRLDVLAGAVIKTCRRSRKVEIGYVAKVLDSPIDEVNRILLERILSGELAALVDGERGVVVMTPARKRSKQMSGMADLVRNMEAYAVNLNHSVRHMLTHT